MKIIKEVILDLFPTIEDASNYEAMGIGLVEEWDSLQHFSFLVELESRAGIKFSIDEFAELKTMSEIEKSLSEKGYVE